MAATRVAVFIDGSNLLGALTRLGLGYPNLESLIALIRGADAVVHARFYAAPPINAPAGPAQVNYYAHWMRFVAANRGVPGLDFYRGYREKNGKEKSVDVALAVDLIHGACTGCFDRAVLVGGDGDHQYAVDVAKRLVPVEVLVMEGQKYSGMKRTGVRIQELTRSDLVALNICAAGKLACVPASQRNALSGIISSQALVAQYSAPD